MDSIARACHQPTLTRGIASFSRPFQKIHFVKEPVDGLHVFKYKELLRPRLRADPSGNKTSIKHTRPWLLRDVPNLYVYQPTFRCCGASSFYIGPIGKNLSYEKTI